MEESLLDQAREVKITPFEMTTLGRELAEIEAPATVDEALMGKVDFADAEDMIHLLNNFGLTAENLLDDTTSEKLKFIYGEARMSGMPLQEFLARVINRAGGRLQENLLGKTHTYLTLLSRERATAEKLMDIRNDLLRMSHENRNSI